MVDPRETSAPGAPTVTATPVVIVRGEAHLEVRADLATVTATVHASDSSADGVRRQLAESAGRVQRVVVDAAAALVSSHTEGLHVAPVFTARTTNKITGYAGQLSTQLVISDLDALPTVVQALTLIPQSQVDGPRWSLRRDHPGHRAARLAAIQDAQRRAADYAEAFGLDVGDLVEVSDLEAGFSGPPVRAFAMARGGPEDVQLSFEPELQQVSASVTVRFSLIPR